MKLFSTYESRDGDTFESISRKVYGTEERVGELQKANPGISEPLKAGVSVIVPRVLKEDSTVLANLGPDEIAIRINRKRFRFWSSLIIRQKIDSISTATFNAPFEKELTEFRENFRQFSYSDVSISIGRDSLFVGKMIDVVPSISQNQKTVSVKCYGLPAVLNDCNPASFPLEFNDVTLRSIVEELASPFGIRAKFEGSDGPIFEQVSCSPENKILSFFTKLAQQRNFVIADTAAGELFFRKSIKSGVPVARLREGESPLISVSPNFNPQNYYSHITGLEPVVVGLKGSKYTIKNPFLTNVIRPYIFEASDTEASSLKEAVEAKMGRMFGNTVSYAIVVNTWRDENGSLFKPNTLINLFAPDAMIYKEYQFVIRSAEFVKESDSQIAKINLVMPGSFSGEIPKELPWRE